MFQEYDQFDALGLAELVRAKSVTPLELVETCISKIEKLNPQLNAVIHRMFESAKASAAKIPESAGDAPFAGVPFLVKDLLQWIPGEPISSGSRFCKGWVPKHPTELYRRYQKSGLVVVGKTNTPEFGLTPVTEPELYGPTSTPWDLTRNSGGSSGGSGSAVGARIVPAAHGGDGGGSIRIPASCCGIFGFKPTRGRTPCGPFASERWHGMIVEHVLSRSVRDSAAMLDVTRGPEPTSPYHAPHQDRSFLESASHPPGKLKIAFCCKPAFPSKVHSDCVTAVTDAARLCEELGHTVEEVDLNFRPIENARAFMKIVTANTSSEIASITEILKRRPGNRDLELMTALTALLGTCFSATDVVEALRFLQLETRRLIRDFGQYDAILTPTLSEPPPKHFKFRPQGLQRSFLSFAKTLGVKSAIRRFAMSELFLKEAFQFIGFTPVANFTGQPSMSVPLHWNAENLPIGVMFTGRFGEDALMFQLAAQLEVARPWKDRIPPLLADS